MSPARSAIGRACCTRDISILPGSSFTMSYAARRFHFRAGGRRYRDEQRRISRDRTKLSRPSEDRAEARLSLACFSISLARHIIFSAFPLIDAALSGAARIFEMREQSSQGRGIRYEQAHSDMRCARIRRVAFDSRRSVGADRQRQTQVSR